MKLTTDERLSIIKVRLGFTLIELLVVIGILSVLAGLSLNNYFSSLLKGRDAKRKTDLENISKALELFYNDNERYPAASAGSLSCCDWGEEFSVAVGADKTVYMQQLPNDPKSPSYNYYYATDSNGGYFKLYSCLENDQDSQIITPNETVDCGGCGDDCNYGISSPNTSP